MFDDVKRNFLLNPQNGLHIKPFRDAFNNRDKDKELLYLAKYLKKIAPMKEFSCLKPKHWRKFIDKK